FASHFAHQSSREDLIWFIDYGPPPFKQTLIQVPLTNAADTTQHEYMTTHNLPVIESTRASDTPPTPAIINNDVVYADAPQIPVTGNAILQPNASFANVRQVTPLINHGFDINASGWQPVAGSWTAQDGLYRQNVIEGFDFITMLDHQPLLHYSFEARFRLIEGELGAGFVINAPDINQRAGAQIVDFTQNGTFLRWAYYDKETQAFTYQGGTALTVPVGDGNWHTLRVVVHDTYSDLYVDARKIATIDNVSQGGHVGLTTSQAKVEFDDVNLLALPPDQDGYALVDTVFVPTGNGLTASADVQEVSLISRSEFTQNASEWLPETGVWTVDEGHYRQNDITGFDYITMLDASPLSHYIFETDIRYIDGSFGAGLILNAPSPTARNNAQIIDFADNGSFLRWGYYSALGDYTYSNGTAVSVTLVDGNWHNLRVVNQSTQSTMYIDGILVATIPNQNDRGHVGFVTSQASVEFDNTILAAIPSMGFDLSQLTFPLTISSTTPSSSISTTMALTGTLVYSNSFTQDAEAWQPVSGQWEVDSGAYLQNDPNGVDSITMLDYGPLDHYQFETRFQHLAGDFGVGLIYNSPSPNSRRGAQIIDFTDQGEYLRWGYFDDNEQYVFQGGITIDPPIVAREWHTLGLLTKNTQTTIYLDGVEIATTGNQSERGYLGLTNSQSQVAFDDVFLTNLLPDTNIGRASINQTDALTATTPLTVTTSLTTTNPLTLTTPTDNTGARPETTALSSTSTISPASSLTPITPTTTLTTSQN
ncbi:MAG: hypothetical protein AAF629_13915, partial [Chloroflexota bacterium]